MSEQVEREESLQEAVEQVETPDSLEDAAEQLEAKAAVPDEAEPVVADVVHIDESGAQTVQAEVVNVESGAIGKLGSTTRGHPLGSGSKCQRFPSSPWL